MTMRDLRDIAPRPAPTPVGPLGRPSPRPPKPRKPLRARNEERAARRFERCFGACSRMARVLGCVVPFCRSKKVQAAHVRTRGAGGLDWANVVGLCRDHHHEQGQAGIRTFQRRYAIDLEQLAAAVALKVQTHRCRDHREPHRGGERCRVCLEAA